MDLDTRALLLKEKEIFIKEVKLKEKKSFKTLSLKNRDDYFFGMEKAFDDAFNQFARRSRKKYADNKALLVKPVADRLYTYFTTPEDSFEKCFDDCIALSGEILGNGKYGIAQKFVNMSFKFLYCYSDAEEFEEKFEKCHLPLDKYTVRWIRSLKDKSINKKLSHINNAWANIDRTLYGEIQTLVIKTLESDYEYTVAHGNDGSVNTCILPQNQLFAEFIIWHQEKINELYVQIKKSEKDFQRLGIEWK